MGNGRASISHKDIKSHTVETLGRQRIQAKFLASVVILFNLIKTYLKTDRPKKVVKVP